MTARVPLAQVDDMVLSGSREAFHGLFDSLFEHSPWVTEATWNLWRSQAAQTGIDGGGSAGGGRRLRSAVHLWSLFLVSLYAADSDALMTLIRAHPSLGDRARIATAESRSEQGSAGLLTDLTPDEHAELLRFNEAYTSKHGFPFILAVKGHDKHSIIAHLKCRVGNPTHVEFDDAIDQIARIAWFRLIDRVDDGHTQPSNPVPTSSFSAKAGL